MLTKKWTGCGVEKPQEAQKAKALWKMKAAKDAGEEHYDPTREDNILGKKQNKKSNLGKSTSKIQLWRWIGPHGELFFFLIKKERASMSDGETFSPFINADIHTLFFSVDVFNECALIAMHLIAEEERGGEVACRAPGLGEEWKMGCPTSPVWESGDEAWSEDESVSSGGSREGNVGNDAWHVIGLYVLGDKISLFLQDWGLAKVALSCHMALDMLCQEMNGPWWLVCRCQKALLSQQERPFSHRGRACDKNGEGSGERMKEKERQRRAPLSWLSWPVSYESFDVRHDGIEDRGFSFLCANVWCSVLREFSMR